jgi:Zn-finger nucleic acid-binding protein
MTPFAFKDVIIDVCPKTGDVWLDGGELEAVVAARRAGYGKKKRRGRSGTSSEDSFFDGVVDFVGGIFTSRADDSFDLFDFLDVDV